MHNEFYWTFMVKLVTSKIRHYEIHISQKPLLVSGRVQTNFSPTLKSINHRRNYGTQRV